MPLYLFVKKINETRNVEARHAVQLLIKNLLVLDPPDVL